MPGYGDLELWVLLVALVGVTLVARCFFLVLPARWQPRGALERALRAAPLAALVAITLPEILRSSLLAEGVAPVAVLGDARLLSALLLAAVWWTTRRGVVALLAGCAGYMTLLALAPR
ncbi:MAG: AzlD domain-containing protein [Betaproteobacteria bacterium]|nr:AzlD domain-containing protein [Rubrivivax sp.]